MHTPDLPNKLRAAIPLPASPETPESKCWRSPLLLFDQHRPEQSQGECGPLSVHAAAVGSERLKTGPAIHSEVGEPASPLQQLSQCQNGLLQEGGFADANNAALALLGEFSCFWCEVCSKIEAKRVL